MFYLNNSVDLEVEGKPLLLKAYMLRQPKTQGI